MSNSKSHSLVFLIFILLLSSLLSSCQVGRTTYAAQLQPTFTPQTILITPNPEATKRAYAPPLTQTPTSDAPLFPTATPRIEVVHNTTNSTENQTIGSGLQ
ncbi:MAG: hypothetical protein P8Y68_05935, partial [Anaerolineales bacterium]